MNFKTRLIFTLQALMLASMLASCSTFSTHQLSAENAACSLRLADHLSSNEIVRYYTFLRSLNEAALAKEYRAAGLRFSESKSASDRLKLAVLLSIPNTAFHNSAKAIDLVKMGPDETPHSPSDLSGFARLLEMLLTQQLADDNVTVLSKALADERLHAKLLQDKIDAIKDMEINRIQKGQP